MAEPALPTPARSSAEAPGRRTWGSNPCLPPPQPRASGRPQRQKHGRALLRGPNTHDTRSGTPKRTPSAKDSLEEGRKLTPTAAGKMLTQVQLRLRLRLRASPCHRPAPPRRLTGHVVRRAPLLLPATPHPPFPQSPGFGNALSAPFGPTSGLLARSRLPAEGRREPHFRPFAAPPPLRRPSTTLPLRGTRRGCQPGRKLRGRAPERPGGARVLLGNGLSLVAARPLLLWVVPPSRTSRAPADGPGCARCGAAKA